MACTSIGLSGSDVKNEGTILAKNRDGNLNSYEKVAIFKPFKSHAYLALIYSKNKNLEKDFFVSAGTNDAGLSVVYNDFNSQVIYKDDLAASNSLIYLLKNYSSVRKIKKRLKGLVKRKIISPDLYLLSDKECVLNIQVAKDGSYDSKMKCNGSVWNTNFYSLPEVRGKNSVVSLSTKTRTATISRWLKNRPKKIVLGDIYSLLERKYNSFNTSIKRDITIAQYLVEYKKNSSFPSVHIIQSIPTQPYQKYHLKLDKLFFEENSSGDIDDTKYGLLKNHKIKK